MRLTSSCFFLSSALALAAPPNARDEWQPNPSPAPYPSGAPLPTPNPNWQPGPGQVCFYLTNDHHWKGSGMNICNPAGQCSEMLPDSLSANVSSAGGNDGQVCYLYSQQHCAGQVSAPIIKPGYGDLNDIKFDKMGQSWRCYKASSPASGYGSSSVVSSSVSSSASVTPKPQPQPKPIAKNVDICITTNPKSTYDFAKSTWHQTHEDVAYKCPTQSTSSASSSSISKTQPKSTHTVTVTTHKSKSKSSSSSKHTPSTHTVTVTTHKSKTSSSKSKHTSTHTVTVTSTPSPTKKSHPTVTTVTETASSKSKPDAAHTVTVTSTAPASQ